ncbi:MAG: quinohemoprotein amine dehydrogenase subunit gamma [Candidatus Sericytochromatia bacterium]|uniref:Quinohemoprotein amine dehydrogenase subunit gamma n=1 Tax=Candidatus Tanganyikabacteria bacterium TaxID=2961651 RepID=A0A938BLW0_9BACT|nr:quinohemoprotein amine dehydrogenase subunit gamma [Candidatus Tanganyikabacteria bacterium]
MTQRHTRRINKPGEPGPELPPNGADEVIPLADDPLLGGALQLIGCTTVFEPGWETDGWAGMTSLCRPMQRDVYGCSADCWWPAQVPDELSNYQGWSEQCGNVEKDWSKLNFVGE